MYIMFDFRCSGCGSTFEKLVTRDVHQAQCPKCGGGAARQISPVRAKLDPISGDFPGATYRWERQHEKAAKSAKEDS